MAGAMLSQAVLCQKKSKCWKIGQRMFMHTQAEYSPFYFSFESIKSELYLFLLQELKNLALILKL